MSAELVALPQTNGHLVVGPQFNDDQIGLLKRTTKTATGCLIWNGAKSTSGYAIIERGGKQKYVHRIIAGAVGGEVVRHDCDTPLCINPDHLKRGTQADNIADAVRRDRVARGERLPQSKLTPAIVESIRAEYSEGGVTQRELADKYGVHQVRISQIVRRVSWARN